MLVSLISKAARRQVRAIVVRQSGLGSLITTARRVNGNLVVEETESDAQFVVWLNEAEEAVAMPLVGWSQRYDQRAKALVFRPAPASGRADNTKRAAA